MKFASMKLLSMKYIAHVLTVMVGAVLVASCGKDGNEKLQQAMQVLDERPDSALALVTDIDPSELKADSLKALYYLVKASVHKASESSMAADSLVRFSFEYYRNRDINRFVRSADLYALHRFWAGDGKGSLELLDSMAALSDIPDSLMIRLLRTRIGVGGAEFDCRRNIGYIKRLQELDKDSANQIEYKYQLCENYQFTSDGDSALTIIDELIDYARSNHLGEDLFKYEYEKAGILEELGRYAESNLRVGYILEHAPHNSAIPYLRFWKALNYFNMGDFARSGHELAMADSCAKGLADVDNNYYESFAGPLREFLEYRRKGSIRLTQLATLNNTQRDQFNRMESIRRDTEQDALRQENRALILKAQNERKTAIIIIVLLAAIIIGLAAIWNIQKRKRKTIEAEERSETLEKLIKEMSASDSTSNAQEALRRAMLQQLGIIKMVAETPTEQNREMLRKISSIESDTNGALVDWKNVYDIIDNLYSGFYSRLHESHGDVLTDKEEQIIVLMMAGFSTKEISVITTQTTATIYVRKSSVRKKLGVAEKEDIVAFLRHEASV